MIYKKEKKIPTILALLLLVISLSSMIYFDNRYHTLDTSAREQNLVENVKFTNVTDSSFTISWFSKKDTVGTVRLDTQPDSKVFLDDLDTDSIPRPRKSHHITIKNLSADTSYNVIILNSEDNPAFTQQTATVLDNVLNIPPAHGSLAISTEETASDAIVYLKVSNNAQLSGRTDSMGIWAIPLHNIRTEDLLQRPKIADNDLVQIVAKTGTDQESIGVIDIRSIKQNITIPQMKIGHSYNFIDLISKKDSLTYDLGQRVLGSEDKNGQTVKKFEVIFPESGNYTTIDNQPRIRGIGIPQGEISIILNSTPQSGKAIVASDGTWSWRPPIKLEPGLHHLQIQGFDEKGNLITINRQLIVFKSGEQVLGDATASASLTPTQIITPTLLPSPTITPSIPPSQTQTPTPTNPSPSFPSLTSIPPATPSPSIANSLPRAGTASLALSFIGGSLALIVLGVKFFLGKSA